MDVVYVCRQSPRNEELRYSLRSLVNLPHDRVWIAGGWPRWAKTEVVSVPRIRPRYAATTANLLAACGAGVSENFVLMNDDFYVMRPITEVPVLHRGEICDVVPEDTTLSYGTRMRALAEWLDDHGHPQLCYEVHAPMVLRRDRLREVLTLRLPTEVRDTHKRSLYGNVEGLGGAQVRDFKVWGDQPWAEEWPFISTNDDSFATGQVGRHIRRTFPDPSPYEVT